MTAKSNFYFSDIACKYEDLDTIENTDNYISYTKGTLSHVNIYRKDDRVFEEDTGTSYKYCLPCEWVKILEKKYRPFTDLEFINKFEFQLGYAMRVRDKKSEYARTQYEYKTVFTGYRQCIGGIEVFLNGKWYTMDTLFDSFEYMENDE